MLTQITDVAFFEFEVRKRFVRVVEDDNEPQLDNKDGMVLTITTVFLSLCLIEPNLLIVFIFVPKYYLSSSKKSRTKHRHD